MILLDSPPVLAVADAIVLSRLSDESVLVVRWRKTPRTLVLRAVDSLYASGAKIAGAVITQVNTKRFASGQMGRDAFLYRRYGSYYQQTS